MNDFNMREIAHGPVRRIHGRDKFGRGKFFQVGDGTERFVYGDDAVDAAHVGAGADIELREPVFADPARMFDDEAVHVHDVKRAVRPGLDLHGAQPVIARSEKFGSLFVRDARAFDLRAVGEFVELAADKRDCPPVRR